MYDFYYNKLQPIYGNKVTLLYMDTDSYIVEVKTHDVYDDMNQHREYYDTSNYDPGHKCYSLVNHKVLGKMKDETHGQPISQFAGLRAKMYSFKLRCIRSMQHQLYTVEQRKVALSSFDDKRYILPDGICTLANGHKDIPEPMDTSD
ncbi:hypothetical protein B566_EDAN018356 [Ephemera danica]|nr:hypothetical protein B566_EDAN018356 [Ephemera danica]